MRLIRPFGRRPSHRPLRLRRQQHPIPRHRRRHQTRRKSKNRLHRQLPNDPCSDEWKFARQAAAADGFELKEIGLTGRLRHAWPPSTSLAAQGAQGFIVCSPEPKIGQAILDRAAAPE